MGALRERVGGGRVVVLLVAAAALTIMIDDLPIMIKAKVGRCWLLFVPWLLLGTALFACAAPALAVRVVSALVIQAPSCYALVSASESVA